MLMFSGPMIFNSIWVFIYEYSRLIEQQEKREAIPLAPPYHFHPLQGYLDNSRAITAESPSLQLASSLNQTGNFWFPSASR